MSGDIDVSELIGAADIEFLLKQVARFNDLEPFAFRTVSGRAHGVQSFTPHEPFDAAQRAGHLLFLEFGVNPGAAITSLVLSEHRFDLL